MEILYSSLFYLLPLFVCLLSALHWHTVFAHFSFPFLQYLLQGSLFWFPVSCWFHAGWHWRGSPEYHSILTPIPAKSPSPLHPGDHMCVLLSFCLQLRQKGMRNAKENSSLLPSKMSATEFTLQAKPCVSWEWVYWNTFVLEADFLSMWPSTVRAVSHFSGGFQ